MTNFPKVNTTHIRIVPKDLNILHELSSKTGLRNSEILGKMLNSATVRDKVLSDIQMDKLLGRRHK
jgi:hypothetical protein